ncbi:uncharacterized protein LOC135464547 [Liolophura sinensis]|uniref:uncharacterized protein LOC135464547 n=1 Tax=Liolophura sinensis TaxID=3198878 RepID=UPI00315865C4
MKDYRQILRYIFVVVAVLLVIGFEVTTARGGRGGGGFRGGFRSGYRSGYRGSRYSGGSRSSTWKTALYAGTFYYGSRAYLTRRRFSQGQAPRICENRNLNLVENGTVFGKFVCPMSNQPDNYDYCCGTSGNERCCTFGDDPGRVAGLVVGLLLGFIIIGVIIFCCCCWKKKGKKSEGSIKSSSNFQMKPTVTPYAAYHNGTDFSGYPQSGAPQGYPQSEPPAYEKSGGIPYSPNPTGSQPAAPPYSPNPVGFVEPNPPNYYSDPNAAGQGYSSAPTRY